MSTSSTVTVVTPVCPICEVASTVVVPEAGFVARQNGAHIQDAFPELSDDVRELLISGTHPECWDSMFGSMEDEDDYI